MLNPNSTERKDALIQTLSEVLWNAGEKNFACVTLNGFKVQFELSNDLKVKSAYVPDGLTEKVY